MQPRSDAAKKDNIFLKTKTHRVLTWPGRILVLLAVIIITILLIPIAKHALIFYTVTVDQPGETQHLVVENWSADVDVFEQTNSIAQSLHNPEVWSLVFARPYFAERSRKQAMVNAWAAGIDTSKMHLLMVFAKEPKTLNNAKTIIDTAVKLGWKELTLATPVFHSARSRKALLYFAKPKGIRIRVLPYFEQGATLDDWYETETGQAEAFSEFVKMLFYDVYVFHLGTAG